MATDGYFTTGMPVVGNNVDADLPEIAENFDRIKDALMMLSLFLIPGYYAEYAYGSAPYTDRVSTITVKDSGGNTKATCTLTYGGADPYICTQEVWAITGGKTYTYPITWTGGKLTKEELSTMV